MRLRRYLPVIAGVVFACAGGSALVAWLAPPPAHDPFADERALAPIPERAPRARRKAPPAAAAAATTPATTTDCVPAPTSGPAATPPTGPRETMLGACPGGTSP